MDCLFCAIATGRAEAFMVVDEPDVVAFLDIRPVFKGHVLVVPRAHTITLTDTPMESVTAVMQSARSVAAAVVSGLGAQGSFVAMNNVVSQSVAHLHVHVVPRTKGDGLRGFFWPRTRYDGDGEAREYAEVLRSALEPQ